MSKKPRGNIHKIREFELEKINLVDEFDILQIVGEGWFGKILLVEHRASQSEMVLKAVPKPYVSLRDFYREFHYGLHLGIHRNIVTTFDVAFETAGFYVFTQEYAPLGDLTSNVTDTGVGEVYSKRVAKQIASALDYMHTKEIVHRDVKLDNVLIYRSDFSRVKLCDFGESYQSGTMVERRNEWLPYSPPEVLDIKPEGTYKADPNHDVWQFGIVIFVCLTGCLPWQKAASDDPRYMRYLAWHGSMMLPIRRTPKLFKLLSSRAQRMFRRFLEPRAERRPKGLADLTKFLDDRWLAKTAEKEMAEYETDELCPSMYSFHSSPDEKHRLLYSLADCGIETNVDRQTKKNRIKDWIEASVITEEDEEETEETASASPSSSVSREPVPGHISSIRANNNEKTDKRDIKTTLKDANQKHFDPRTGALQQGPSEMGVTLATHEKSVSPSMSNISIMNNGDSLCGSMATLSSRQELIASQLDMYTSELDLNRLGELNEFDNKPYFHPALSSDNLLNANQTVNITMHDRAPNAQNHIGGNALSNGYKRITQRSKSDSVKAAMFASTPSINHATNYFSNNTKNRSVHFATNAAAPAPAAGAGAGYNSTNNNTSGLSASNANASANAFTNGNFHINTNSATMTGLANAFQSLAQITLPPNALMQQPMPQQQQMPMQKQQQQQFTNTYYFNRQQNDSQVKDSAYGSVNISETSLRVMTNQTTNGTINNLSGRLPTSSSNTMHIQNSQQQYSYGGSAAVINRKDTAYDRVAITNNSSNRR